MICTATSKRTGEPCGAKAVRGRKVCYHHGGRTPRGIASPQFRTGRYSSVLPGRLLERYQQAERDPDRLALSSEIALVDSRLADVLDRLLSGESGRCWRLLKVRWAELRGALASGDPEVTRRLLSEMGELIQRGAGEAAAWAEVDSLIARRTRLVESERRRVVEAQQILTAEQAAALMGSMAQAVREYVYDEVTLRKISERFTSLATYRGPLPNGAELAVREAGY